MNLSLLKEKVQDYIDKNIDNDPIQLLFKKSVFPNCTQQEIVEQIEAKAKARKKLPTWFSSKGIYYPNKLNISQTSSEVTAKYKADLVSGETLIDVTGGFGVDTLAFSKKIQNVVYVEQNEDLAKIAEHNFLQLNANNIKVSHINGSVFLEQTHASYDWIYIDPSRRSESKERVFLLKDCSPDVTTNLNLYFSKSNSILIKAGPLLDIKSGINELKNVKEIHIVALDNEVKEILWLLQKDYKDEPFIKTINITKSKEQLFTFNLKEEQEAISTYSEPLSYLYEPNVAILKSGAFICLGKKLNLNKLHKHSHLYTSDQLIDFPGRIFRIDKIEPFSKHSISAYKNGKANITSRNFPESVAFIRKKYKIKDGGDHYIFLTMDKEDNLILISCSKT
ncbi:class I SAM-dependent methyltransferase [Maribacter sp. CXY002]|uniref:class I SAM-dependent methyltransferase n=1 Tax=Maribacter luteocoastalis TaxID=3407671 RepID=UPI003B67E3E6